MMTHKKSLTDDEKRYGLQIQQENELASLRKQFLILDQDFERSTFHTGRDLEKYSKILKIFNREHEEILKDLSIAGAPSKKREDAKISEELADLVLWSDCFTHETKERKKTLRQIEDQIKRVNCNVVLLTSRQVTDRHHQERIHKARKIVEALENRLEVQMRKFGTICTQNASLREDIDRLMCDRKNFMRHWNKLLGKLLKGKHIMLDLIEQATIAYDQREEWCERLQALRMKAHHDYKNHLEMIRDIKRQEDNSVKLRNFLDIKGRKRVLNDLIQQKRERHQMLEKEAAITLKQYRHLADQIFNFTKTTKLFAIAHRFVNQQEENFMYFKMVNELLGEMYTAEEPLSSLYMKIEEQHLINATRSTTQKERLERWEELLLESTERCQETEKSYQQSLNQLKAMMQGIDMLFQMTRCQRDPLLKLLGDHREINQFNVLLYIGLLESKMHELVLTSHYQSKSDSKPSSGRTRVCKAKIRAQFESIKPAIYTIDQIVLSNPCPLCVEQEMVSQDTVDRVQRVWGRKEVLLRLAKRLALPDGMARVHNTSKCHLPKAREIIQKRYT